MAKSSAPKFKSLAGGMSLGRKKKEIEEKQIAFDDVDLDYRGIRENQLNKQKFEELEQTSEYMETHYY